MNGKCRFKSPTPLAQCRWFTDMASLLDINRPERKAGESRRQYAARTRFDPGLDASTPTNFDELLRPRLASQMTPRLGSAVMSSRTRNQMAGNATAAADASVGVASNPLFPPLAMAAQQQNPMAAQASTPMVAQTQAPTQTDPLASIRDTAAMNSAMRWPQQIVQRNGANGIFRSVVGLPQGQRAVATFPRRLAMGGTTNSNLPY